MDRKVRRVQHSLGLKVRPVGVSTSQVTLGPSRVTKDEECALNALVFRG